MHVAVVVTNYPPHQGGVEQHLAGLTPRLVRRGVRCTVVCLGPVPGRRVDDGVEVTTLRRRLDVASVLALPDPAAWHRTADELSRAGVTHVATHTRFFPMSLLGVRLAARLGVPSVHTEHGAGPVRTGRPALDRAGSLVDATLGRRVLRGATELLAVSAQSAEFVRRLSGRPAAVIGNAVDLSAWVAAADARADGHLESPEPLPRLVFAGRLTREKGWADFLEVVEALVDVADPAEPTDPADAVALEAVIAGAGPDLDAVRREVAARGLGRCVRVPGDLAASELAAELAGAVYVNPSRAAEGFQLTQLEAVAAGAQVVTYDVGVARELERVGAPVWMVPPGDLAALTRATRSAVDAPRPATPAGALDHWDWDALADRYVASLVRAGEVRT